MALEERLHNSLYASVGEAVNRIAHMKSEWTPDQISGRVVRYMYKAAADPELLTLPWEQACAQLVERSMNGYTASCGEMAWFYEIDLVPAYTQAAMEIVAASGQMVSPEGVQEIVHAEYEDKLDRNMLDKAVWDVVGDVFTDDKVKGKVFHALQRSYWPALDEILNDGTLHREMMYGLDQTTELQRVEAFTRRWLDDGISRAWVAIEQSDQGLTEETVMELLRRLIAPFGIDHPFSCLPGALTEGLGRPPPDWAFIRTVAHQLFRHWNGEAPASKKRKTKGGGAPWAEEGEEGTFKPSAKPAAGRGKKAAPKDPEPDEEEEFGDAADEEADGEAEAEAAGHPLCTSSDDCIGSPDCTLIRHMHNGKAGDLYCELCWDSFCSRNPNLKGVVETDA